MLYKSTIVIISKFDPSDYPLSNLALDAENPDGDAIIQWFDTVEFDREASEFFGPYSNDEEESDESC